jgi:fructose-1,6-bisphosphatase/inositol monophosphatase family enzyme
VINAGSELRNVIRKALLKGHKALMECIRNGLTGVEGRGSFGDYSHQFDLITEKAVIDYLKKSLDGKVYIVSEESGEIKCDSPEIYALIDPVDGSNNVANGIMFCASAILISRSPYLSGALAAGVIDHSSGKIYLGDENGISINGEPLKLRKNNLSNALVFLDLASLMKDNEDAYNPTELSLRLIRGAKHVRFFAAASLEIAHILEGRADVFACLSKDLKIMDFAASVCLLRWAGGAYKILGSENPSLLDTRRYGVVAASSRGLLDEILALWD